MKKLLTAFLAAGMIFSLAACGNNKTASQFAEQTADAEKTGSEQGSTASVTEEAPAYTGMFYHEGELIIIREDGTITAIAAEKESCIDGTYSEVGDQYHFVADNTSLNDAYGTFDGSEWIINDITYHSTSITGSYSNEDIGDGIIISSDGTFEAYLDFENKRGKIIGTYEREGYQWIFTSPGLENGSQVGTFYGRQWLFDGDYYTRTFSFFPEINFSSDGIYAKGDKLSVLGSRVKNLEKLGFATDADYDNISVKSGAVSELEVTYKNAKAIIKAINPFENDAALADCLVCSFYTEDTTGVFQLDNNGTRCGEENYDKLLNQDVYEYTPEKLVYKKYIIPAFDFEFSTSDDPKGEQILSPSGYCDLTLTFDGAVLTSFGYVFPDLLYNGLEDNVDSESLNDMDMATMEGVIAIRNDIFTELKAAFEAADIEIDIDDTSGEIVMDNSILFERDSYELSDTGKNYIDRFMKVYATVLLSDKFADVISEVHFEGHTDSSGDFGYNQKLSQNRAEAVLNYCLNSTENGLSDREKEMLENLSTAVGYSCTNLVYDENGTEDADASRRVVVKFFIDVN